MDVITDALEFLQNEPQAGSGLLILSVAQLVKHTRLGSILSDAAQRLDARAWAAMLKRYGASKSEIRRFIRRRALLRKD